MEIRKLITENLEINSAEIKALFGLVLRSSFDTTDINQVIVDTKIQDLRTFISDSTAIVFGAFENTVLVGFVWAYELQRIEKRIHVDYIAVHPDFQRAGIAKRLLEAIIKEARNRGIHNIDLWVTAENNNAIRFYEAIGFTTERLQLKKAVYDE